MIFLKINKFNKKKLYKFIYSNYRYTGHRTKKYRIDCAFNKTDSIVITGSEDGKIYYWNLLDSKLLGTVNNDNRPVVHSLSTNVNKDELLTASENYVYVWSNDEQADV